MSWRGSAGGQGENDQAEGQDRAFRDDEWGRKGNCQGAPSVSLSQNNKKS